jgi:hypothetical protein
MRGEELVRGDIGVVRKHWRDALTHPEEPHVPLGMAGRFKRQVGEKVFVQPLALESTSGLQYRLWMHRALQEHGKAGAFDGPMFRVEEKQKRGDRAGARGYRWAKVGDLDTVLRPLLLRVQEKCPETAHEGHSKGELRVKRETRRSRQM